MSDVSFDLDELLDEARAASGLSDFGSDDFRVGLEKLLETYDHNGFDEDARRHNRGRLLGLLSERLRIEDAWARHPEIRDVQIDAPMYLTGLPRTGTSALLNLLSQDPAMRPMELWEGMNPSPLPGNPAKEDDPRYLGIKAFTDQLYDENPDFARIHHTSADTAEECIHLLNHTFQDVQFGIEVLMEPYGSWFREQDHRASYLYYADILRMLQWCRPGERFLLKTPAHLWALDILVDIFPDCSIVITHRDPVECVGSYASMMESLMTGRSFDRRDLGPTVMEYLAAKLEYSQRCRAGIEPSRIIDIGFTDLVADPVGAVQRIYGHFGIPMTPELEQAFADYTAAHPQGEHGTHDYRLDEYGLSEQQILDRFAFYTERFPAAEHR
ncbi:MAG: sulfotransferase [Acidimicrobiia bacterium]